MPTGRTLLRSSVFRLSLAALALLCVAGAVLSVHYFAQAAPVLKTDKDDYSPEGIVTITGGGFAPNTLYAIPVIRPDGSIVTGDGSFSCGWDTVQSRGSGAFTYRYQLDGIVGIYEVRAYPSPWDGNLSEIPLATITFTDGNVKVHAAPDGVTFTLTATQYSSTDCTGTGTLRRHSGRSPESIPAPARRSASAAWSPPSCRLLPLRTRGGIHQLDEQ